MDNLELKRVGLKVTIPRIKILEILEKSDKHHMSAEDVYRILLESEQDIGLATVYRVLTQFEAAGLVTRHNFESGYSVFELNEGEHHDHLVCNKCGTVEEFYDEIIESRQYEIAKKTNFAITEHNLTIYGLCAQCTQK